MSQSRKTPPVRLFGMVAAVAAVSFPAAQAVEPPSVAPPELNDPLEIVLDAELQPRFLPDFDRVGCEGYAYRIRVPDDRDARVTMGPRTAPLEYPVWITGGRNVHVLGLELRTVVQSGCDVGEANQPRDPRPNVHPRLPGSRAFRLEQRGTTYIEGVDIDLAGQEADCFVSRNRPGMSPGEIKQKRNIVIVNTRCTGYEGLEKSSVGDGIHGDFFQNQGKDDIGSLVLENVTYLGSSNGITLHRWNGGNRQPRLFSLKNVNYGWDARYSTDDRYERFGLAFTASADRMAFEEVWIDDGRGLNYGIVNRQRFGAYSQSGYVKRLDGIGGGRPPSGDFAPANQVGIEYERTGGKDVNSDSSSAGGEDDNGTRSSDDGSVGSDGPELLSPQVGSPLVGSTANLRWSANGTSVRQWYVRAGSVPGGGEYFDSGHINNARSTGIKVTGLPADNSVIYIQFSYKDLSGSWVSDVIEFNRPT